MANTATIIVNREPIEEEAFVFDWCDELDNMVSAKTLEMVVSNLAEEGNLEELINIVLQRREENN